MRPHHDSIFFSVFHLCTSVLFPSSFYLPLAVDRTALSSFETCFFFHSKRTPSTIQCAFCQTNQQNKKQHSLQIQELWVFVLEMTFLPVIWNTFFFFTNKGLLPPAVCFYGLHIVIIAPYLESRSYNKMEPYCTTLIQNIQSQTEIEGITSH